MSRTYRENYARRKLAPRERGRRETELRQLTPLLASVFPSRARGPTNHMIEEVHGVLEDGARHYDNHGRGVRAAIVLTRA